MGKLPDTMRAKAGMGRFNILGVPSLYLSNTSYCCWMEMDRPADSFFNVSVVKLKNEYKVLDLAYHSITPESVGEETLIYYLKLLIINTAISYRIREANRSFKIEYVVSNMIACACVENEIAGISYNSTKMEHIVSSYGISINTVFFANSLLDEDIHVHNAINFGIFKQLDYPKSDIIRESPYCGKYVCENEFLHPYSGTYFYLLDKYLEEKANSEIIIDAT